MNKNKKNQQMELPSEIRAKIEEELQQLAEIIVDEYLKRKREKRNRKPQIL